MSDPEKENTEKLIRDKFKEMKSLVLKGLKGPEITRLESELWKLSKQKYALEIEEKIENGELKRYKGIIFTVGFSRQPIILNIIGIKPQFCFFIHSPESEKVIDAIVEETGLKPSSFHKETLKKNDAAATYDAVKNGLKYLQFEKKLRPEEIALDPTGGTKAMSVGCGIATNSYNIDLLYVDNTDYDPELRRPRPGSERLVNVVNPFHIYYDDVIIEGLKMLQQYDFEAARECFIEAETKGRDLITPKILCSITIGLQQWDLFNHEAALKSFSDAMNTITHHEKLMDVVPFLKNWSEHLEEISTMPKMKETLILDMYYNAERSLEREQFDYAAMRYYRTIEMILQHVLKTRHDLDTQDPDYEGVKSDVIEKEAQNTGKSKKEVLLSAFNEVWKEIFKKKGNLKKFRPNSLLPQKIGLVNDLVFCLVFQEPSLDFDFLFQTFNAVETRNNSILAHGIRPISKNDCERLKKSCDYLLKNFITQPKNIQAKIFNKSQLKRISKIIRKEI
ncbi:MAG: TIGR02710 family CRISPR-associated CARF protein [Candidatus Helarchaeales archaeon]